MKVEGVESLVKNFDKYLQKMTDTITNNIVETNLEIAKESAYECPYDTSELVQTLQVTVNNKIIAKGSRARTIQAVNSKKLTGKTYKITAIISYNKAYAIEQHENTYYHHPTPGTKAKYLEDPFQRSIQKFLTKVTKDLREVLKK